MLRDQVTLRSLIGTLVAVGCVVAAPASSTAQAPQVSWKECTDWGCVGQVKLNVTKWGPRNITGSSSFAFSTNDEIYFEDLSGLRPRKLLQLGLRQPHYLYFGVSGAEEVQALHGRYQSQLSEALVLVLVVMAKGFPEGAGAIPTAWESRLVEASGVRFTVSAKKTRRDAFEFRAEATDHRVEGDWIMTKATPWPDRQPMAGWTAANGAIIPSITLGEVRQFRR